MPHYVMATQINCLLDLLFSLNLPSSYTFQDVFDQWLIRGSLSTWNEILLIKTDTLSEIVIASQCSSLTLPGGVS